MKERLFILLIIFVAMIPILWFNHLPLVDYPNHLARLQIKNCLPFDNNLATFFSFHWKFTPYLALDLLATPLLGLVPVELLGRIIIIFSFILIYCATIFLDRQLNGNNWGLSIFVGIFLYNGAFHFGFINYVIGIGFAVLGFGFWVRYREMALGFVLLAFIPVGMIIFLMHLYAFGIYAVCVCGYEVSILLEEWNKEYPSRPQLKIPAQATLTLVMPPLVLPA